MPDRHLPTTGANCVVFATWMVAARVPDDLYAGLFFERMYCGSFTYLTKAGLVRAVLDTRHWTLRRRTHFPTPTKRLNHLPSTGLVERAPPLLRRFGPTHPVDLPVATPPPAAHVGAGG